MLAVNIHQYPEEIDLLQTFTTLPVAIEVQPDPNLQKLIAALSPDTPWGDRQIAARELGFLYCREALPALLTALPEDSFWMVRCAIIQALERIGDPGAIPTLGEVARNDDFQVVRAYAAKAIERLSQGGKNHKDQNVTPYEHRELSLKGEQASVEVVAIPLN